MDMYLNNIIVSATGFVGYFFAGGIVRALGPKRMMSKFLIKLNIFQDITLFYLSSLWIVFVGNLWHHALLLCEQSHDTYCGSNLPDNYWNRCFFTFGSCGGPFSHSVKVSCIIFRSRKD